MGCIVKLIRILCLGEESGNCVSDLWIVLDEVVLNLILSDLYSLRRLLSCFWCGFGCCFRSVVLGYDL